MDENRSGRSSALGAPNRWIRSDSSFPQLTGRACGSGL